MNPKCFLVLAALATVSAASAQVHISEWMYNGSESVELTNVGTSSVDITGWSFDDSSRTAGSFSLSDFRDVAGGLSVFLAEETGESSGARVATELG
jgi:hypothetical protein